MWLLAAQPMDAHHAHPVIATTDHPCGLQRDHCDGAEGKARLHALENDVAADAGDDDPDAACDRHKPAQHPDDVWAVHIPRNCEFERGDPGVGEIERVEARGFGRHIGEDLLQLNPADQQNGRANQPSPRNFKRG